jgi:hypothetical protein
MTWLEFKNAVKVFLTVDAVRLNTGNLVEQLTRQAVIDLQSFVEQMRYPHSTTYLSTDLEISGYASVGTLPDQAKLRDAYVIKNDTVDSENACARSAIGGYSWANRYDLICGNPRSLKCSHAIAISPQATTFVVYPSIAEDHRIELFWEGIRLDFVDDSVVPFGERAAMAAAMYVKAGIIREVDRDVALALSYIGDVNRPQPNTYYYLRRMVYLDEQERRNFADNQESSGLQDGCANSTTCAPVPA